MILGSRYNLRMKFLILNQKYKLFFNKFKIVIIIDKIEVSEKKSEVIWKPEFVF